MPGPLALSAHQDPEDGDTMPDSDDTTPPQPGGCGSGDGCGRH
ncbi:hypothetical protein ACFV1F_05830 [Streptomyces sp. NPDC059590]